MTTPTREQVIEWAEEAGAIQLNEEGWATVIQGGIGDMQRFAVLAMSAGRDQGLREAKEVCDELGKITLSAQSGEPCELSNTMFRLVAKLGHGKCAAAIEQLRAQPNS